MKKMAAIGFLLAIASVIATPAAAQEFCGDRYCPNALISHTNHVIRHIQHRHGSANCPRHLGCGCNLANYFRIAGKRWRELWVARNWAHEGSQARRGCVGCVAVLRRGRGGHVGVVRGYDGNGNPIIYSYANGRLGWTTATYPARRVLAYRSL